LLYLSVGLCPSVLYNFLNHTTKCLLNSCEQILRDGTYVKNTSVEKLKYGTMLFLRAMIVLDVAARGLAQATTIAIRYSCVRRQSELKPRYSSPLICPYKVISHMICCIFIFCCISIHVNRELYIIGESCMICCIF